MEGSRQQSASTINAADHVRARIVFGDRDLVAPSTVNAQSAAIKKRIPAPAAKPPCAPAPVDKWLAAAERHSKLPKLRGGLWHRYRRKWATEREHLPLKDVAAAGGWQDVETLLECYQQPDHETLKSVMDGARTLHEPPASGEPEAGAAGQG